MKDAHVGLLGFSGLLIFLLALISLDVLKAVDISKSTNPVSACFAQANTTEQMNICKELAEKLNESIKAN